LGYLTADSTSATLHRLRNLQGLLQLLLLLVEHADGFGPLGDLVDFDFDRNGIGHY
jgi:hypothetical protein